MDLSLIPEADCLDFEGLIWPDRSKYKRLVDADNWIPCPGSATHDAETTLPAGYQAALPTEPVPFQTMMCHTISTDVAASMYTSAQATPPPPGRGGGGRGSKGGQGGNTKQVVVTGNCNLCGKVGHYVREFPERNMY